MLFPEGFITSINTLPGFDELGFNHAHQNPETIISVRRNPYKKSYFPYQNLPSVPWCTEGFYLEQRPIFTLDPLFHAGAYYVQEASSMFIEHIFKHLKKQKNKAWNILDLCAAPGGKSTLLSSNIDAEDLLLCNEIIKTRVPILCDNMNKWGQTNVSVSNNDPKDFNRLGAFFDVILVDAPCSGSGMFRKDPETMKEWSSENVQHCSARQERILHDIYPTLETDGYLIYATCSYSEAENEHILDLLCSTYGMDSIPIPLEEDWAVVESTSPKHGAYGYRFYPGKVKGEGFFVACLQKKEENTQNFKYPKFDFKKVLASNNDRAIFAPYLKAPTEFEYLQTPDGICAVHQTQFKDILWLQKNLYLKKSGVKLGKIAGKSGIPEHELALSNALNPELPKIELDLDTALRYLRKEDFILPNTALGWQIVAYQGAALGWIKNLGNRINNYYPKALRILMS